MTSLYFLVKRLPQIHSLGIVSHLSAYARVNIPGKTVHCTLGHKRRTFCFDFLNLLTHPHPLEGGDGHSEASVIRPAMHVFIYIYKYMSLCIVFFSRIYMNMYPLSSTPQTQSPKHGPAKKKSRLNFGYCPHSVTVGQ